MKTPVFLAMLAVMANLTACQSSNTPKAQSVVQTRPAVAASIVTPKPVTPAPPPSEPVLDSWIADASTGCKVYNPKPVPNESIRWKGRCKNGLAAGKGTLQWFERDQPSDTETGNWRDGKKYGSSKIHYSNGDVFKGNYSNNERNGPGTYRFSDGTTITGIWRDDDCIDCPTKTVKPPSSLKVATISQEISPALSPATSPADAVTKLCNQFSRRTSIDGLRCENATKNVSEDTIVGAIQVHCQSYEPPGKKLACFETGKTLLPPRDAQQIANYEDSCQGSKGKVKADCYSEVYEQVGIKQTSEQAQAALAAEQKQQAENYAAQQRQQQESRVEQRNAIAANCRKRCSDNYSNCMSSALTSTLSSGIMSLATGGNAYTQAMGLRSSTQPLTCQINKSTCESGC